MLKHSSCELLGAALTVAALAAPCAAADYATVAAQPGAVQVWFSDMIGRHPNGHVDVHIVEIHKTPKISRGKSAYFFDTQFDFNCKRMSSRLTGITSLDEDKTVVTKINMENLAREMKPGPPLSEVIKAACSTEGPTWTHSDDDDWTVLKQQLMSLKTAP